MDTDSLRRARALLAGITVWDNHACMPLRPSDTSFLPQLERVRASGVDAVTLNIGFGPISLEEHLANLEAFRRYVLANPDRYLLATHVDDISHARASGRLAVMFDVEGLAPFDAGDQGLIAQLREHGVVWMLIAYNRNNASGGGCLDEDGGLTPHGRALIAEMRRVGMMVCCSHTGHRTAREVIDAAGGPVIFSHSNASAVHPHPRNIPDDLIRACAAVGGVVGVNGVGDFLGAGEDYAELMARHIDHIVQIVGPEHVGISLDYVYDQQEVIDYLYSLRETFGAEQVAQYTSRFAPPETFVALVAALLARGYPEKAVSSIVGGNWLSVARRVQDAPR